MPYLEEFKTRIHKGDFPKFLQIWEEYSNGESVTPQELKEILSMIEESDFARPFGKYVETALPLWSSIESSEDSYQILKILIDLQTTNSPLLQELSLKAVTDRYFEKPHFDSHLRLVGLRGVENFQGAISNFDLLVHMAKGKFVFHTGGWGAGEIVDISLVREQVVIEFENYYGKRDMSFKNAFKMLKPLPDDHFLARRFGDPDKLEEEARKDPAGIVRTLLKDLGPKTAGEIKDEMCDWVIPEEDWSKWWQNARAKLKKDTLVETPSNLKKPFVLRKTEVTHVERLHKEILHSKEIDDIILTTYNFVRDFPNMLKKEEVEASIEEKLVDLFDHSDITVEQEIQLLIFLENLLGKKVEGRSLIEKVAQAEDLGQVVDAIPILAFKKRFLTAIRKYSDDWSDIFLSLLFELEQNPLRDYILKELNTEKTITVLEHKLEELLRSPKAHPSAFVWYFQKIASSQDVLFNDKDGQCEFLEAFLVLMHGIERDPKHRDLVKKMYNLLTAKRYAVTRYLIAGASIDFLKEFLLLVTKCQTMTNHDVKIMRSLAEVVQPSLTSEKPEEKREEDFTIWTTTEGYNKTIERVKEISDVEMVHNSREIEEARAHGDLKENAEYKCAKEKRARLQGELKLLSEQVNRARILTSFDIDPNTVGVGTIVTLVTLAGDKVTYTLLGPWDSNPDQNILSFQSKLAQAMMGLKEGEEFDFRHEHYTVVNIKSYL